MNMENTAPAASPLDIPVMRHTPGPWHWESDAVKNDPTGRVRYQVTATGKTITRVYYSSFEGGPTNAEADARLIAAAPELLAALMNIRAGMIDAKNTNIVDYIDAVIDAAQRRK